MMELHILKHQVQYTLPHIKLLFRPHQSQCKFFSLRETPKDYTLMLDEEDFKELPLSECLQAAEATWLVLNGSSNPCLR